MERFEYAVHLEPAEEGICRDVSRPAGSDHSREDVDDALSEASDAMDEVFAHYMSEGLTFPAPTRARRREHLVSPPPETVAKAALHAAMQSASVSKVQLARRLGVDEKEVRRLLDPHHSSKLPRIAEAVQLLGRRLVIGLEDVALRGGR